MDFILKKFCLWPLRLRWPNRSALPLPLSQNPMQNGKHYLVLGVGYVGYANQVGVGKLGLAGVGYVGYPKQTANIANTMQRCARSVLRRVGGCWLCWHF